MGRRIFGGLTLKELALGAFRLRRVIPALAALDKNSLKISGREEPRLVFLRRWSAGSQVFCVMNFDRQEAAFNASLPSGSWKKLLDSADEEWEGLGSSLPEFIEEDQALTISGVSLALYELGET